MTSESRAIIARQEYAKEQPQNVAKYLAVYLRAQKWSLAHRKEADILEV